MSSGGRGTGGFTMSSSGTVGPTSSSSSSSLSSSVAKPQEVVPGVAYLVETEGLGVTKHPGYRKWYRKLPWQSHSETGPLRPPWQAPVLPDHIPLRPEFWQFNRGMCKHKTLRWNRYYGWYLARCACTQFSVPFLGTVAHGAAFAAQTLVRMVPLETCRRCELVLPPEREYAAFRACAQCGHHYSLHGKGRKIERDGKGTVKYRAKQFIRGLEQRLRRDQYTAAEIARQKRFHARLVGGGAGREAGVQMLLGEEEPLHADVQRALGRDYGFAPIPEGERDAGGEGHDPTMTVSTAYVYNHQYYPWERKWRIKRELAEAGFRKRGGGGAVGVWRAPQGGPEPGAGWPTPDADAAWPSMAERARDEEAAEAWRDIVTAF